MHDWLHEKLPKAASDAVAGVRLLAPGLVVVAIVSIAATFLSEHYGAPLMLMALLLGMAVNFLSADPVCKPGIVFASSTVLRFGVALLGARITFDEILTLGFTPVFAAIACSLLTIAFGIAAARMLGLSRDFGILTGGATGICGASAALAISSVLMARKRIIERHTVFTILGVTTFSTIAMVLYPALASWLGMPDADAGIFLGASIHDVAQVVGAGYSISAEAGDTATLTKLMRVAMLVPIVIGLSVAIVPSDMRGGLFPRIPWFLTAFVALLVLRNINVIPADIADIFADVSRWALVAAIAALGVKTVLKELATLGPRSIALLGLETMFIAALALTIVFTV
jgi:uncharacterized integral membrane protein (TIGR00698 family)